jgi:hypothetical protein
MIAPPYGKSAHAIRSASGDRAWKLRLASFAAQGALPHHPIDHCSWPKGFGAVRNGGCGEARRHAASTSMVRLVMSMTYPPILQNGMDDTLLGRQDHPFREFPSRYSSAPGDVTPNAPTIIRTVDPNIASASRHHHNRAATEPLCVPKTSFLLIT